MYGFPPIVYQHSLKYKGDKSRGYINKSYINVRQILYNKKKKLELPEVQDTEIEIITTL